MNHERDLLTGLYNRGYGLIQLERELATAKQHGKTVAVLFTNIDHFKVLNEVFGHINGDVVLCEFANVVQRIVSDKGTVCRFGKDEFVVLLPSSTQAKEVAEQICDQLAKQPMDFGSQVVYITATTGVGSYPANGQDAESLWRAAEEAVLQSKKSGRRGTSNTA